MDDCQDCARLDRALDKAERERDAARQQAKDWENNWTATDRMADELRARAELAERERAALRKGLDFRPLGDNHHSADACPYCSPHVVEIRRERDDLRKAIESWRAFLGDAMAAVEERDGFLLGAAFALAAYANHLPATAAPEGK